MSAVYDVYEPGRQWPISSHLIPTVLLPSVSRREAIILNSVLRTLRPPHLSKKKKKKGDATRRNEGDQKKCHSIYIIINKKEIYLILQAKDLLFPLN